MIKFQCEHCNGIVATDFGDPMVICGHCENACTVPQEFGPRIVVDDFGIIRLAGQGGMGDVYLAHQFSLDRTVALKILKEQFSSDMKFMEEFVREARSVASLNHPNIIQAYKVGEDGGLFFFAMEYVEGKTLAQFMKEQGVLDQELAIDVALEMTRALGYAWDQCKMVHRDIKPENIMVTEDGTAKLMDMGLSRKAEDTVDDSDVISGTPQYISPEQIVGNEMDIRGDFYSLGATLYHLMTGRFVFEGTLDEMIHKHVSELPIPARKINPDIHEEVSKILSKLLGKLPEDRYQSAKDLERDLLKAQKAVKSNDSGKKKRVFKLNTSVDPSSTGRNPAIKTDKNKAARAGRTQSLSKTDKKSAIKTGRNRGVTQTISKTGKNLAGSTGKNKSINTGRHPQSVTTTTGNINKRRRPGEKTAMLEDKKKNNTPIIIGSAVVAVIIIIIIIAAASGGGDDSKKQNNQNSNNNSTNTSQNQQQNTASSNNSTISPEEKALMEDPNFMKAIKDDRKLTRGLTYKYYEQRFNTVNQLAGATPKLEGKYPTFSLDIKKRKDDIGFVFEGYVNFPKTEKYKIYLGSDDGSRLYLDDKVIVVNDGDHGFEEKMAEAILEKGLHKIKIEYYQGGSDMGLDVELEFPGFEKSTIPRRWFYRDY